MAFNRSVSRLFSFLLVGFILLTLVGPAHAAPAEASGSPGTDDLAFALRSTSPVYTPAGRQKIDGRYDQRYAQTIEPSLHWNTFLGGMIRDDRVVTITTDANGNIYAAGYSFGSWGSPVRAFTFQMDMPNDAFVAKLSPSGELIWNTFLGGEGYDSIAGDISVDASGNVYVAGESLSFGWGSPLQDHNGSSDGFVARLDSSGELTWNTFLGGPVKDFALDASGNIHVAGSINGVDVFAAKLDSTGALTWNTVLGGDGADNCFGLTLDVASNIYVFGRSDASWGTPVRAYTSDLADGFVAKLNSSGDLDWNTFLGGSDEDTVSEIIKAEGAETIYVSGSSRAGWGTPVRPFEEDTEGVEDIYVARIDSSSGGLTWNTFLGGGRDFGGSITMDGVGNVYVAGASTATWGSPVRPFAAMPFPFTYDGFIARLDSSGALTWNSFLGSDGYDDVQGIALDDDENIYAAGESSETWESPLRAYTDKNDVYVAKMDSSGNLIANTFMGGSMSDIGPTFAMDQNRNIYLAGTSMGAWGSPLRPFVFIEYTDEYNPFVAKVDITSPIVESVSRVIPTPTSAASIVSFRVTFSEPVTGVDAGDFTLTTSGLTGAFVSNVIGSGATRTVVVNNGVGDGTIRLDVIDDGTITDVVFNPLDGGFTGGESYTIDKPDLPPPALRSPRNNSVTSLTAPTFQWTSVNGGGGYEIEVATDQAFPAPAFVDGGIVNTTSFTPAAPLSENVYYWHVRARTAGGQPGAWSVARSFTIDTTGPDAPALTSPSDDASIRAATFRWGAVSGAATYEFQLDNDLGFTDPLTVASIVRGTSRRLPALPTGTYYWRVRAKDALGNWGAWSTTFTVNFTGL